MIKFKNYRPSRPVRGLGIAFAALAASAALHGQILYPPTGIALGQTLRVDVSNRASPVDPCRATVAFLDPAGNLIGSAQQLSPALGATASADLDASLLVSTFGVRAEARPSITTTGSCALSAQVFDNLIGWTTVINSLIPTDPNRFFSAGIALGQTARLTVSATPTDTCFGYGAIAPNVAGLFPFGQSLDVTTVALAPGQSTTFELAGNSLVSAVGQRAQVMAVFSGSTTACSASLEIHDNLLKRTVTLASRLRTTAQAVPPDPVFPPLGLSFGQRVRTTAIAPSNAGCTGTLGFRDAAGNAVGSAKVLNLDAGASKFVELSAASLGVLPGGRKEVRPFAAGSCMFTAETYDIVSGWTAAYASDLPSVPPDPVLPALGVGFGLTLRANVYNPSGTACTGTLGFVNSAGGSLPLAGAVQSLDGNVVRSVSLAASGFTSIDVTGLVTTLGQRAEVRPVWSATPIDPCRVGVEIFEPLTGRTVANVQ